MKRVLVPAEELQFKFSKSSGSGGQNVNKLNTRVTIKWNILKSRRLEESVKKRFLQLYKNKINEQDEVLVSSQKFRLQARNIVDALEKLQKMLGQAATPPKVRKKTKTPKKAKEGRLRDKKHQSEKKSQRNYKP